MYIHELEKWPHFVWNQGKLEELLPQLRYKQGLLVGGMESVGFHLRDEAALFSLTQDVVKTSEIEGENLDWSLVRSSVARHLGMDLTEATVDKNVEGVVEMLLDATQNFKDPLTKRKII